MTNEEVLEVIERWHVSLADISVTFKEIRQGYDYSATERLLMIEDKVEAAYKVPT